MKKKPAQKRARKSSKRNLALGIHPLFFVFVALLLIGIASFFFLSKKPFCANSISCLKNLSGNYEKGEAKGVFEGKEVSIPTEFAYVDNNKGNKTVLGETTAEKHIYVDLTHQRLYATEGNTTVYNFPVSTGKWNKTPTGDFKFWIKLRYTRMSGGSSAIGTYYNLPNVPYTMYYYNDQVPKSAGYSIHGAYWHNNFGHPMSHGCINMKIDEAKLIYEWANPPATGNTTYVTDSESTPITVSGVTPDE